MGILAIEMDYTVICEKYFDNNYTISLLIYFIQVYANI